MKTSVSKRLQKDCLFKTKRTAILNWNFVASQQASKIDQTESVLKIMTPNVTKSLPDGWQNLNTVAKAEEWIIERRKDSYFYAITLSETNEIIGFLFLYLSAEMEASIELRLGYLLSESIWGKGIGTELINGLVKWGKNTALIDSISGGVEKDNIGSIKVLEKNGFYQSNQQLPGNMLFYKIDIH